MILPGSVSDERVWEKIQDESVHTCITSPPYWGLRAYGTDPAIWPNSKPLCDVHEWQETAPRRKRSEKDVKNQESKQATNPGANINLLSANVCVKCGAWRGELGLEPTPEMFVEHLVYVFRFIWKKLRKDGVVWLNLGDTYAGSGGAGGDYNEGGLKEGQPRWKNQFEINRAKDRTTTRWGGGHTPASGLLKPKDLCMIPARVALALQADGWYLRSEIVWFKRNPMPESVTDRPTKAHEMIYLLTKSPKYYYDQEAVRVPQKESSIERAHYSQIGFNKSKSASGTVNYINNPNTIEETQRKAIEGMGANLKTVWDIPTQSFNGAHFATFPEKIPELCIKAGTSEKGACSKCGSPWVRVVAKTNPLRSLNKGRNGFRPDEIKMEADKGASSAGCVDVKTLGWKPSRKCGGYFVQSDSSRRIEKHSWYRSHWQERVAAKFPPTVPCIVFDPFAGSGTTLRVAKRMNRDFVGIELNPKYITDLIEPSLAEINPLGLK